MKNKKTEEMLLFQILEEHIKKNKKKFEPCSDCIRLGINKGYDYGFQKAKLEQLKEDTKEKLAFGRKY